MTIDINNLLSGFIGAVIALLGAFGVAWYQQYKTAKENEKQRKHEMNLFAAQKAHDKDMQRRENNIRNTGMASRREVGGG
ncbi:hypothetical protein ACFPK9_16015 [Rubritalea spongiae]|uniref:Phage protein n=1 Tax=Rubritalea spongiae TaxID=430797 RepID=A0ABW5E377_9BACT